MKMKLCLFKSNDLIYLLWRYKKPIEQLNEL